MKRRELLAAVAFAAFMESRAMADPTATDDLGVKGLPAHVECLERSDGKGGVDVVFTATRVPDPGSGNGTTSMMTGVLHSDNSAAGVRATSDASGQLSVEHAGLPVLRALGLACRAALAAAPGVAG